MAKKNRLISRILCNSLDGLAERTGLEPATPGVTGRYSNQLNYRSILFHRFERATAPHNSQALFLVRRRCSGVP